RQAGCSCPHYKKLEDLACSSDFSENPEATILDTFAEHIAKGSASGEEIADVIHEIFVENNVIDEKRFGLAILCTDLHTGQPLELYNTETYGGVQQ
ncbi:hypothetical protein KY320_02525, partial [Candidatus Woesearchaeota archaeon]|nr:hypothetical protein [Candidatus Woesearchaeota archaeon]